MRTGVCLCHNSLPGKAVELEDCARYAFTLMNDAVDVERRSDKKSKNHFLIFLLPDVAI